MSLLLRDVTCSLCSKSFCLGISGLQIVSSDSERSLEQLIKSFERPLHDSDVVVVPPKYITSEKRSDTFFESKAQCWARFAAPKSFEGLKGRETASGVDLVGKFPYSFFSLKYFFHATATPSNSSKTRLREAIETSCKRHKQIDTERRVFGKPLKTEIEREWFNWNYKQKQTNRLGAEWCNWAALAFIRRYSSTNRLQQQSRWWTLLSIITNCAAECVSRSDISGD